MISLEAVIAAIRQKFTGKVADGNAAAATAAYEMVLEAKQEAAHA